MKLPTIYLPHGGGPCFFMDWTVGPPDTWDRLAAWLRSMIRDLPERPKALLVVSAHWETRVPTVQTGAHPPMLFDYYGFPRHTYELTWPAPGAPDLARRVRALLDAAGIPSAEDPLRGFDHGVFVPLLLAVPDADLPTAQLSIRHDLDPAAHLALGRALAPLREEGVLIVGSGMSFHNVRVFLTPTTGRHGEAFDAWLAETCALPATERDARLARWTAAPGARASHPREDHLLPLMVAAGAGGEDPGRKVFGDTVMNAAISAIQFG